MGILSRLYNLLNPPVATKNENAIRCGILGAANIAPPAFINPAISHPEVIVSAVASRGKDKAEKFAKKHGIQKVYSGDQAYQQLIDDPDIDAVYNPLPNGLHFEWTAKALEAGKHVLLEKPSTDTADETRKLFQLAETKGLVLLEAFHYRFHPAIQRVKEIVHSGELGGIKSLSANLCIPGQAGFLKDDDIRFKYHLGGGIMMDMGCYPLSAVRYISGSNPTDVLDASAEKFKGDERIDVGTTARLAFPKDIIADIKCHCRMPGWGPFSVIPRWPLVAVEARCEGGTVSLDNFPQPTIWHKIVVKPTKGKSRVEYVYTFKNGQPGEAWWTTYRYQLEAFVNRIKGREPQTWMSADDSVANMEWIEKIYQKTGFGVRPASAYTVET